jgi:hypothetical protein
MKLNNINLRYVEFMPKHLEPGILYVSTKYGAVAHLCACGCGEKIRTPLGETEWSFSEKASGPSLWPSVGNWQKPCQSHYVIDGGEIIWCGQWTPEQIMAGRRKEEALRVAYLEQKYGQDSLFKRFLRWLKSIFAS